MTRLVDSLFLIGKNAPWQTDARREAFTLKSVFLASNIILCYFVLLITGVTFHIKRPTVKDGRIALWDSAGYCVGYHWYSSAGSVSRHQFRSCFVAVSLAFSHLPGESSVLVDGSPAFRVGAVEHGGELRTTLDTLHLWVCCWACLRVLLWWSGWRGDQSFGWETLGGFGPRSSESRADGMGGLLVCPVICAVLLLILSLRHHQFKNTIYWKVLT